ncbi:MAG: methylated-DNA--[protein]-cysteine S-methyltransferase [Spirochaetales bacterium]|nr:methylated-DNA--[protein]-cysteine S-methyltransferase [Spirochaetales bacterium]
MMQYQRFMTQLGEMTILWDEQGIRRLHLGAFDDFEGTSAQASEWPEAVAQLQQYTSGKRQAFSLPLAPVGSEFQSQVWQVLQEIPYGETWSYKDVAIRLGQPKASRAVGAANGKNPIPILIPCHRVVGVGGALTGFAFGVEMKAQLLKLEHPQEAELF